MNIIHCIFWGGIEFYFVCFKDEEIERGDGRSSEGAGRKQPVPGEVTR